jgi:hypothetical protein
LIAEHGVNETEVIACPACKHVLRVPADWLGATVQCPECQAKFTAPRRDGDRLTEPILLSPPEGPAAVKRKVADRMLWAPAFGLMLVGVVSLVVNGLTLAAIARDPAQFEEQKKAEAAELGKLLGQDLQAGANNPGANWRLLAAISAWGIVCAAASFLGGLGIVLRRWYRLARLGSALAIVNVAGCCCVPGAVCGIWASLLLMSEEGREHFGTIG